MCIGTRVSLLYLLAVFITNVFYTDELSAHGDGKEASQTVNSVSGAPYHPVSHGVRKIALDDVTIRILIDSSNIGRDDIEIGELVLPVGSPDSGSNAHNSLEIFYVVEGILGHDVNGEAYSLHPGDVGYLKPGDQIVHRVLSETAVKALVIWVPGGESEALVKHAGFKEVPLN